LSVAPITLAVHSIGAAVIVYSVAATFGSVAGSPLRPDVWFAVLAVTLRGVAAALGDASDNLRTLPADFGVLVNCPSDVDNRSVAADNWFGAISIEVYTTVNLIRVVAVKLSIAGNDQSEVAIEAGARANRRGIRGRLPGLPTVAGAVAGDRPGSGAAAVQVVVDLVCCSPH
jgi:hypothetical protein